jgi:hypothetical protein
MKPTASQIAQSIVVGLLCGLVIGVLAVWMAGGGHGSNAAMFSVSGMILIPLAALGRLFRHARWGRIALCASLLSGVIVDMVILRSAFSEEARYVRRLIQAVPVTFFSWLVLWLGWQIQLVALYIAPPLKR